MWPETEFKMYHLSPKGPGPTPGPKNLVQWPPKTREKRPKWAGFAPYTDRGLMDFPPLERAKKFGPKTNQVNSITISDRGCQVFLRKRIFWGRPAPGA